MTTAVTNAYSHSARQALAIEIEGLEQLHLLAETEEFAQACGLLQNVSGKIAVIGIGKSGHIGRKISATLASVGFPAFFIHAAEALHGDLGMLRNNDVALLLSYSGSSDEITNLLPALRELALPTVAITGNPDSQLARAATVHLALDIKREACPHNLAPTTSTTATLVLGDMLAMTLLRASGNTREDFARSHPAGRLGKRLRLIVADVMQRDALPLVADSTSLMDTLLEMSKAALGIAGVHNSQGEITGVFTDGDLRRSLQNGETMDVPVSRVMTKDFFFLHPNTRLVDALESFEQRRITAAFVLDDKGAAPYIVGVLHMHAILRSGIN